MTSRTLRRFLATILLVGALIAPTVLTTLASMPILRQAGPVVIDFDDLDIAPGRLMVVSNQYDDLGVTFNDAQARDFAAGVDDPAFVHSGSHAVQQCFSTEFCSTPLIMTFSEPQGRVKVWVGLSSGSDEARKVSITGFDGEKGGDAVATASATLGPSESRTIPVQTPLEITANAGTIRRVEVGFSPPSEFASSLVFDDVEFEAAPDQVDCPDGTVAPEIALAPLGDASDVQIKDFTLQGRVETSSPLTSATLAVANGDGISHPLDVLSRMPRAGGAFGPILVEGALQPGENTVTLTVGNCADVGVASADLKYSPIAAKTRYKRLGLEVTQSIQNPHNAVRLIADKRTFVRVYLRAIKGTREIRSVSGRLRGCTYPVAVPDDVQQECLGTPSELPPLEPLSSIIVNDTDDLSTQRVNLKMPVDNKRTGDVDESQIPPVMNYGLLFELPPEWIQAGHLRLQFDAGSLSPQLRCNRCSAITDVTFVDGLPLDLNLVDTWYEVAGTRYEPREIDHQRIESWLERAYPTDTVTVSSLTEVPLDNPPSDCKEVKTALFESDSPAMIASRSAPANAHARYYGLVASPSRGLVPGCTTTSAEGEPVDRYAVGPAGTGDAYVWDIDGSYADFYAGHEIGHTYGRKHPGCGDQGKDDGDLPKRFSDGYISDKTHGHVGFDTGAFRDDSNTAWLTTYPGTPWRDMMTYCDPEWISAYTYQGIADQMGSESAAPSALEPIPAPAPGQQVLLVSGIIDTINGSFIRRPLSVLPGDLVSPRPAASTFNVDYTINLIDNNNKNTNGARLVTSYLFNPRVFTDQPAQSASLYAQVAEVVPWVDGTDIIQIKSGNTVLDTIPVNTPPTVTLTAPNGGESLGGSRYLVTWKSSDTKTRTTELKHTLLYSTDDGVTWQTAVGNISGQEYWVDPDRLPGSDHARFRIIVTDGVLTAQDDSDAPFTVADKAPRVNIDSPGDGVTFTSAHTVVLNGHASDVELGELDGDKMTWSSNLQGKLGEGRSIGVSNLTPGQHTITLTANDGVTPAVTTSISITITDANPPQLVWPSLGQNLLAGMRQGQFFYDSEEELGTFYTADGAGGIQHVRSFDVLLNGWTAIVPGNFGGEETTDLLFYDSQAGIGEFFASNGTGELQLLSGNEGFTRGWDIIVPGNFDDDAAGWTDLFFYNAEEGEGKFYTTDGTGRIRLLGEPGTFRNSWTSILAGEFGGDDHTDLLFYDKAAGLAQLYTTDGEGGLEVLNDDLDWSAGWDQIVTGNFGEADGLTDLFLFDAETGNATFLAGDSTGTFVPLGDVEPFSTHWTTITGGEFGGDETLTDLFFYDAEQGLGQYYLTDGQGGLEQLSSSDAFPMGWDQIVPGYFKSS